MAAPRRAGRSRFTLFVLLLASVTLLTLDARDFGPVVAAEDAAVALLSPLRGVGDAVFGPLGDSWSGITDYDDLETENAELRARVTELQSAQIEDQGAAEELAALREQLDLRATVPYDTLVAEVVAGSISNFDGFVVEINRGRADGLRDDMPVLAAGGGLVGRVEEAGSQTSRVRLITDPEVSVGALVVGTDEVAIVSGGGEGELLEVGGRGSVRVSADVEIGDVMVTVGGDRSAYPPGLAIGTVVEVVQDEGALEKQLRIEPAARPERLRFVTVVLFDPGSAIADDETDAAGSGEGTGG